ncbi:hypothetical protein NPIL_596601 [Nephila pilipes]|uniref:Uncharacterized protein n=1 Tax=Nephila pilipes TaxID=299642 RepID=A0A8X6Q631_NEPPI|nr:hypothetical protein NPIL_596601 [Nephila pilipes]
MLCDDDDDEEIGKGAKTKLQKINETITYLDKEHTVIKELLNMFQVTMFNLQVEQLFLLSMSSSQITKLENQTCKKEKANDTLILCKQHDTSDTIANIHSEPNLEQLFLDFS